MKKRTFCLCLVLALLVALLAGCGKKSTQAASTESADAQDTQSATQYTYQAQYFDLPEGINWINEACVLGQSFYFTSSVSSGMVNYGGDEYGTDYYDMVYRYDLNDGTCDALANYVPTTQLTDTPASTDEAVAYSTNINIQAIAPGANDTLWLFRQTDRYAVDGSDRQSTPELLQIDTQGTLLRTITPSLTQSDDADDMYSYFYIDTLLADDAGNVYTYDYQTLHVYGADGSLLLSMSSDELDGWLCQLSSSEIGIVSYSTNGKRVFRQLDPATKGFGKETPVSSSAWNLYPGDELYAYYFTSNDSIFAERRDTGEIEKVVDWLSCDVDSNELSSDAYILPDGRIVTVSYDYRSGGEQQLLLLTRVDASTVREKAELHLACFSLDSSLRSQIVKFNRSSADYRIVVTDYADYSLDSAADDDYTAGLSKLNTEIISGNVPDILAANLTMPMRQYEARGLLEDLWAYIDADPEFSRDSFVSQPLAAMQSDGRLYQLPLGFGVVTAVGLNRVVGEYETWTLADLTDAMGKLRQDANVFDQYVTQEQVLQYCVIMNADSFIDWQSGSCSFDSDEFQALLSFAKLFPAEYSYSDDMDYESEYSRLKNGKQLLSMQEISDFDNLYYTFAALDNDIRFVGFPREDGSSGSSFSINASLAITTACKDKAGAWAFIRSALSEDYQDNQWDFPIIRDVFDAKAATAMEQDYQLDENGEQVLDENGEPIPVSHGGMSWGNEEMIELYALTQEQYDVVLSLIDTTTTVAAYDTNLMQIISEEAAGFLAGDKTVDEAARLIQSRATIYIQEQR